MTDIALITLALPVLIPLFAIISLAIILDSRGSIFYGHLRYGMRGKPFKMLKFRTMIQGAHDLRPMLAAQNELQWPLFKISNDPRVTWVGRFLRRTSLDELPQIINVLRGDMTLIGPRAHSIPPEQYEKWQLKRLSVVPGIASPAQIHLRHASFSEKAKLEIDYIEHPSFKTDMEILIGVLKKVILSPDGK